MKKRVAPNCPPLEKNSLRLTGVSENNLKNISISIPHDELVVVTGLSGSGKSSLAFDTVYAEGQRRYIETFSPYVRQFLDKVKRPDIESAHNVRPAIAIQQRTRVVSSRSTVGSMTGINDLLKVLYSTLASPFCPSCGVEMSGYSAQNLARHLESLSTARGAEQLYLCAEVTFTSATREGELDRLKTLGFSRVFDISRGVIEQLDELSNPSQVLLVIDRIRRGAVSQRRLTEAVHQAYEISGGSLTVVDPTPHERRPLALIANTPDQENTRPVRFWSTRFFEHFTCPAGRGKIARPRPALFSPNHPYGACPTCKGFGQILTIDRVKCVPDAKRSIRDGALQCWSGSSAKGELRRLLAFCETQKISVSAPWNSLLPAQQELIFSHKGRDYRGVTHWFARLEKKAYRMHVRVFLSKYRTQITCPTCNGARLRPDGQSYQIQGMTLPQLWSLPIDQVLEWNESLTRSLRTRGTLPREVDELLTTLCARFRYLVDLGLPYLSLNRPSRTLSGGETQRVNLAAALGSDLVGTHFILDEPSVGLHARDTERLTGAIRRLQQQGNSLLVVEHDPDIIAAADTIIELGPEAGSQGGTIVYNGPYATWGGLVQPSLPAKRTPVPTTNLTIERATARNLKSVTCSLPLGQFVCLTGVSGSGKSTLVSEVILPAYERFTKNEKAATNENCVTGFEGLSSVECITQSPLTKSPRATIATYSGIWDEMRMHLAATPQAQERGFTASSFSFNVDGGRCPMCKGAGLLREDMQFLSDIAIECDQCQGRRFQESVLAVTHRGLNVHDILSQTVAEAYKFFQTDKKIAAPLRLLVELGLGHLTLGHPLSELSGGEAQRLKLVPFLATSETVSEKGTLFIFDEPTTGLHVQDIGRLIQLFQRLVAQGHSVLCIEHNLMVIAACDYLLDLGPEGGLGGGELLGSGTPEQFVVAQKALGDPSHTARFLRRHLAHHTERVPASRTNPVKAPTALEIRGASHHNLRRIDLDIPLNTVVALTGMSGSGKSTIAKDIVYAEGQRRYLDCLSPYARQYIRELRRPEIESIRNIPPTICVYQHTFQPSRLSTIATMTEVYNYLRLLFAKLGVQHCPDHPTEAIRALSPREMAEKIKRLPAKTVRLLAPIIKKKKGTHREVITRAQSADISQIRIDGVFFAPGSLGDNAGLARTKPHSIEYVVAKLSPAQVSVDFILEGVQQALALSGDSIIIHTGTSEELLSSERACPICQRGFFKPDPEDLSFSSPRGRCPTCQGFGAVDDAPCTDCGGSRLNARARNIRLNGETIFEICNQTAPAVMKAMQGLSLGERDRTIAEPVLAELMTKLETLTEMGLTYLPLARDCATLSGGELQRLRLGTALGSPLTSVLYILDEPSAGLHPLDNARVLQKISSLQGRGNSILMIEHDPESILSAPYVIDVGPGGGKQGGQIVFQGPQSAFHTATESITAQSLHTISVKNHTPRKGHGTIKLVARGYRNLRSLSAKIPRGALTVVAGVSGAGKSSLVHGVLSDCLTLGKEHGSTYELEKRQVVLQKPFDKVVLVDQQPLGANSRSTPASYLGIWDHIRKLFATLPEAKARGFTQSTFSYNTGKGRCPECKGMGLLKLEMNFLADTEILCETCLGARFTEGTRGIRYQGRSVTDILALTFEEARVVFTNHRHIVGPLRLATELGLGYLTIGQPSPTLSGGESQRLRLVAELQGEARGENLYILDEPTTGLHKVDISRLVKSLNNLVTRGHTVVVIEHDEELVAAADYVLELGPGPGDAGGTIIFEGTVPELERAETPWGAILRGELRARERNLKAAPHFETRV